MATKNSALAFYNKKGKEGIHIVEQMPADIRNSLLTTPPPLKEGEIVIWESDSDGIAFGIIHPSSNSIQMIRVDESGYFEPIGTPTSTEDWDEQDAQATVVGVQPLCKHVFILLNEPPKSI